MCGCGVNSIKGNKDFSFSSIFMRADIGTGVTRSFWFIYLVKDYHPVISSVIMMKMGLHLNDCQAISRRRVIRLVFTVCLALV